jgi:predicted HicB family RNase H-like nuclease
MAHPDRRQSVKATSEIPRPAPAGEVMKSRVVRCDDELWEAAGATAAAEGVSVSAVVRHYLQHYVDTAPGKRQSR